MASEWGAGVARRGELPSALAEAVHDVVADELLVFAGDGFGVAWNEIAADSVSLHTAATRSEILYRSVR